jgi:DNA-binding MarR family transcriptional regulator
MKEINLKESLGHLFHIIYLKMRKKLDKKIKEFGLTSSHQFGVLLLLLKAGSLTQKQISDATLGDEPNTTRMISTLIKNDFVKKQQNQKDKREQLVSLTENGKILLAKLIPLAMEDNKAVENLITEEEYKTLLFILNKLNDGMD